MTSTVGVERARQRRLAADYSARRLAKFLGAFCAEIGRAREFGLLPEPDRPGGCWSAVVAGEIRARWWPEIAEAVECVGVPGLRRRGWSGAMTRDLLGPPDTTEDGRPLWRLQRVVAAEALPEFTGRAGSRGWDGETPPVCPGPESRAAGGQAVGAGGTGVSVVTSAAPVAASVSRLA